MAHGVRQRGTPLRGPGLASGTWTVPSPLAQLLRWSESLAAIARTGLGFTESLYERERFEEVLRVAADIGVAADEGASGVEDAEGLVQEWLSAVGEGVPGYVTPKVAVGAAVGNDKGELLLVKRADSGVWLYPTGWADVGYSAAEVVVKEVLEETGIEAEPLRLIAVLDGLRLGFTARAAVLPGLSLQGDGRDPAGASPRVRGRGVVLPRRAASAPGGSRAMESARLRGVAGRAPRRALRPTAPTRCGAERRPRAERRRSAVVDVGLSPSLGVEPEADTAHGHEVLRSGGVSFELDAQPPDMGVERAGIGQVPARPQPVDQLVTGAHLPRRRQQQGEQVEFATAHRCTGRPSVVTTRSGEVDPHGAGLHHVASRRRGGERRSRPWWAAGPRAATRPGCGPRARAGDRAW